MAIFLDDAPHVAGTVITLTILAFITFGLRVYVRITRRAWGMEDWLMTVAMFPFTVLSIACLASSFNGVGIHEWRLAEPANVQYQKGGLFWFFLFEVFYCGAIIPIKLSISWMLVRVAQNRKPYIYSQYVVMGLFTVMNVTALFYIIFQCNPVAAAWDTSLLEQGGVCQPSVYLTDVYYATTAVNITTDWITALMPIPLLRNVQLNRNSKISVAGILGLGILASISACIRLKYTVALNSGQDYLFGVANILIWGYAENGLGVFVGNISTLRPLFRKLLHLGSDGDTSGGPASGHKGYWNTGERTGPASNVLNRSRANKDFQPSYELSDHPSDGNGSGVDGEDDDLDHAARLDKYGQYVTTTTRVSRGVKRRGGGDDDDSLSDSESQKQILADMERGSPGYAGMQSPTGIVVSRKVEISRS